MTTPEGRLLLRLDSDARVMWLGTKRLNTEITPSEAILLELLIQSGGGLVSHTVIGDKVWGTEEHSGRSYPQYDARMIATLTSRLRTKLEKATAKQFTIGNVRGAGYRLQWNDTDTAYSRRRGGNSPRQLAAVLSGVAIASVLAGILVFVIFITKQDEGVLDAPISQTEGNIISNGSFTEGLDKWLILKNAGCGPEGSVFVHTGDAHFVRTGSNGCGGSVELQHGVNLTVSDAPLILAFRFRIVHHDLCGGGTSDGEEAPMHVEIGYRLPSGSGGKYWHGFYSAEPAGDCKTHKSTRVPANEWQDFSVDLSREIPRGAFIPQLTIGGNGWDFEAWLDDVSLSAPPSE